MNRIVFIFILLLLGYEIGCPDDSRHVDRNNPPNEKRPAHEYFENMQDSTLQDSTCTLCNLPGPLPYCKGFIIFDFDILYRLSISGLDSVQKRDFDRFPYVLKWELGYTHNLSANTSLGLATFIGADVDQYRIGLMPRYRHWWNKDKYYQISTGIILFGNDFIKSPGFVMEVSVGIKNWIAFSIMYEILKYEHEYYLSERLNIKGNEKSIYGGLTLSSNIGIGLGIIGGFVALIAASWSMDISLDFNQ